MTDNTTPAPVPDTVRLIDKFKSMTGLDCRRQALRAIFHLNQSIIQDAGRDIFYTISERSEGRIDLAEIYEAHLERARSEDFGSLSSRFLKDTDMPPLTDIRNYMLNHGMQPQNDAEVLRVATTVAKAFYDVFGEGKTARLSIPAVLAQYPAEIMRRQMVLKMP